MDAIFLLIPIAVVMLIVACLFFFWAVRSGQFDDMDGPAQRILLDDKQQRKPFATNDTNTQDPE